MESGAVDALAALGPAGTWFELWRRRSEDLAGTAATDLAISQGFVARRTQLLELGCGDNDLRRLVRRREWSRPDRGTLSPVVVAADGRPAQRERHALRSTAAALLRPGHVIAGASAAVLHGLPTLIAPDDPVLTTLGADTEGRRAALSSSSVTSWFGAPVSTVARTVVDQARLSRRDGIMAADAALHESLTTARALREELDHAVGWPGVRQAREIVALADGAAESPLESIVRLALHDDGFPPPKLQQWVAGYRVDFLWPEYRLILEADGRVKYVDDEGWVEKRRQLALHRADHLVERVVWSDIFAGWPALSRRLWQLINASPLAQSFRTPEID